MISHHINTLEFKTFVSQYILNAIKLIEIKIGAKQFIYIFCLLWITTSPSPDS